MTYSSFTAAASLIICFLPISHFVKSLILFPLLAPLMIGVPVAEVVFLAKEGRLLRFKATRQLYTSLAIFLVMTLCFHSGGQSISGALGLACAVTIFGSLSGGFFKRMTQRGLM